VGKSNQQLNKEQKRWEFNLTTAKVVETAAGKNFVNWHAQQTKDGEIKAESFSMRDEDKNRIDITPMFVKGVAFLLSGLKTGWTFSNGTPGVSPQWMWNESPAKFDIPEPPPINNQKWKKGFVLPLAIDKDTAGVWQQGGAGAWKGLTNLMRAVQDDGGDGEVAVLAMQEEVERISFQDGVYVISNVEVYEMV
jgi:hypothetical protein